MIFLFYSIYFMCFQMFSLNFKNQKLKFSLPIFIIYYYTETHQYVEITAPSFPAALTSVGSQLQRIRRQAFVSSRNRKRRGEGERSLAKIENISGQGFLSRREPFLSGFPVKEEISFNRSSWLKIFSLKSVIPLARANCSLEKNFETVLQVQERISRTGPSPVKEGKGPSSKWDISVQCFLSLGEICLGTGFQDQEGISRTGPPPNKEGKGFLQREYLRKASCQ